MRATLIKQAPHFPEADFWGISVTSGDPLLSRPRVGVRRVLTPLILTVWETLGSTVQAPGSGPGNLPGGPLGGP